MEQYGPNAEFTRIVGMPDDLKAFWSKRRKAIVARAGELGIPSLGSAPRSDEGPNVLRPGRHPTYNAAARALLVVLGAAAGRPGQDVLPSFSLICAKEAAP